MSWKLFLLAQMVEKNKEVGVPFTLHASGTFADCECLYSQGINESANFRFLQRLSVIFGFHGDCL